MWLAIAHLYIVLHLLLVKLFETFENDAVKEARTGE